ncbi:MAG TPA: GldG family protein [Candidatus Avimonas sp.]|nr:GldG family protein [Clostridiales bacterium]HPU57949.1 GldG family protein [Candidatus Avimonas sp.]
MKDINNPQEELRNENLNEATQADENMTVEENIQPQAESDAENIAESAAGETEGKDEAAEESEQEEASAESEKTEETKDKKQKKNKIKRDLRRLRYGGMATAVTAAAVAVVVLINVIASILNDRFPLNLDLTSDKLFTLSDESKELAKNTKKETEIVIFSKESQIQNPNTGTDIDKIVKQFYEFTKQFESLSGGKIKTTYVDLAGNPAQASIYNKYEPKQEDILFICGNRWHKSNFKDLYALDETAYYYYGMTEITSSKVENVLSSNIAMVTSDVTPLVTILTGHSEDGELIEDIENLIKNNNYETVNLDITGSAKFDEKSVLAIIAAPTKDYSDDEIEKIRTWLKNEGSYNRHLAVFLDYNSDLPNLFEFLNVEYGLEVTDNLIVETDANRTYRYNPYNIYGDIGSSDFTSAIADSRAIMPVVRQILTNKENNTDNSLYNVDLITFPESSRLVNLADVRKQQENNSNQDIKEIEADEYPLIGAAYATKWGYTNNNEKYTSNVFVSGSSAAFTSSALSFTTTENEALLLSVFNGFTGNESPITISSKSLRKDTLEFTTAQQSIFFMIFVVAIPVILLATCLAVFIRRRRL